MKRVSGSAFTAFVVAPFVLLLAMPAVSFAQTIGGGGVNVLTWHNDAGRTGQNLSETILYPTGQGAVSSSTFGQLCSVQLDGQIYGQPLVVTNVTVQGYTQAQTVVYVVTQNDRLFAINGTPAGTTGNTCGILNGQNGTNLLAAGQSPVNCANLLAGNCQTVAPNIGALGTPVISLNVAASTGTLYVVTEAQDSSVPPNFYHWLHAVDITTFQEVAGSPVQIVPQTNCDAESTSSFSLHHIQRPGLLYVAGTVGSDNYVYIGFSMMDGNKPLPNGLIFQYDVSQALNTQTTPPCFATTPGTVLNQGGGVWQGGAGLAYGTDKSSGKNYLYFATGNGNWDGSSNFSDSFIKLNPNPSAGLLTLSDYFTPSDQAFRNCSNGNNLNDYTDADFGSGGVLLVPESQFTYSGKYMAVSGDKEGILWAMDRGSPGKYNSSNTCSSACNPPVPCTQTQEANNNLGALWPLSFPGPVIHNTPAYWHGSAKDGATDNIFIAGQNAKMMEYPLGTCSAPICPGTVLPATYARSGGKSVVFQYGATPSVSANGTSAGIIWAIWADGSVVPDSTPNGSIPAAQPGILFGLDPNAATELYGSDICLGDRINPATKFSVPTVANGYVYVGTQGPLCDNSQGGCNFNNGALYIFGKLSTPRTCP